jgi:hypothetical protein
MKFNKMSVFSVFLVALVLANLNWSKVHGVAVPIILGMIVLALFSVFLSTIMHGCQFKMAGASELPELRLIHNCHPELPCLDSVQVENGMRIMAALRTQESVFKNDLKPAKIVRTLADGRIEVAWDNGCSAVCKPTEFVFGGKI